jgi:hypothetical protein
MKLLLLLLVAAFAQTDLMGLLDKAEATASKNSFLEHVRYFAAPDGQIDATSIATNWQKLTKDYYATTYFKGTATIRAANQHAQKIGCPWKERYGSATELMPMLKHPADTGVVNSDGSINRQAIEYLFKNHFAFDADDNIWYITKSSMAKYLAQTAIRDKDLDQYGAFYIPWTMVADAEWNDAFKTFSDYKENSELAMTAQTFLMFYYNGTKLYDRVLNPPDMSLYW